MTPLDASYYVSESDFIGIEKREKNVSNLRTISFALTPNQAKNIEHIATGCSKMAWDEIAKVVRFARNALYVSIALTALAAIGTGILDGVMKHISVTVCVLAVGLTVGSAKRLYDCALFVQECIDFGWSPLINR